jgi:hypothetical protein
MLAGALQSMSQIAMSLGENGEAQIFREKYIALCQKINDMFFDERGFYRYSIRTVGHEPVLGDVTTTYANGYAFLFGVSGEERSRRYLDYLSSVPMEVPGPYFMPPIPTSEYPPGVYVNGGCGWGRGVFPSVARMAFMLGRYQTAYEFLTKMAQRAVGDGSFYEYWTWSHYTGATKPGGAYDYSETASGFLDGVISGLFGILSVLPGYKAMTIAPAFPPGERKAEITLHPFLSSGFHITLSCADGKTCVDYESESERDIHLTIPTYGNRPSSLRVDGVLVECQVKKLEWNYVVNATLIGRKSFRAEVVL